MDKTIQVSLGGRNFIITEDGYQLLHSYISNLKEFFKATSPDNFQEIVDDFEFRIAEIFCELLNNNTNMVVNRAHVSKVIEQLGNVNDFAEEQDSTNAEMSGEDADSKKDVADSQSVKRSKRLYRDTNNALLGGVLAGLAAYMGIDKTWLRLAIVLLIFIPYVNFPFLLVYIIMWLIVPPAKTVIEQMRMRGEDLSADTIAKNVIVDSTSSSVPEGARTVFKVLFFLLMLPIAFLALLLIVCAVASLCVWFSLASNFGPEELSILRDIDEEFILAAPMMLFLTLLVITLVLFLVRLIFKGNVMKYVYVGIALSVILGIFMYFGLKFIKKGDGVIVINKHGNITLNHVPDNVVHVESQIQFTQVAEMNPVMFEVSSANGYSQLGITYSLESKMAEIDSLIGGKVDFVQMSTLREKTYGSKPERYFLAWQVTDGWFGYTGAVHWKSSDAIACIKPFTDGTFGFVGCKPGALVGSTPSVTLRYANINTGKCVDIDVYIQIVE